MKPQITFDHFSQLDLRVGEILGADRLEQSDKLLKLTVEVGEEKPITLLAGLAPWYDPEILVGKQTIVVANLAPKQMAGEESQGMLLAADVAGRPILIAPQETTPTGTQIR